MSTTVKIIINIIRLCFFIVLTSCSIHQEENNIESFLANNKDLLPERWNGWTISRHQDHNYLWIEIAHEGITYPRIYYSRTHKQEFIKYSHNGVAVRETATELPFSSQWAQSFPFVSPKDLLARVRWFDGYDLDLLYGNNDTVCIKARNYQLNRYYEADSLSWADLRVW